MSSKVLIVDDEEAIVKLVSFNLEKEGFETLAAYDGREALDIIRREPLDLVVLDVMLPEMDGLSSAAGLNKTTWPSLFTNSTPLSILATIVSNLLLLSSRAASVPLTLSEKLFK